MKAALAGILLVSSAALAAPPPSTAPIEAPPKFHPLDAWGGIGYYNVGFSSTVFGVPVSGSGSDFGFNGGASYAYPLNNDFSALGFGNVALAFGDVFTFPITVGGGARIEHAGPVQVSGLLGFTLAPIGENVGTKVGLSFGVMAGVPLPVPSVPGLGAYAQFMYHWLTDSVHIWTINAGFTIPIPMGKK
jgi:hypothetical protein